MKNILTPDEKKYLRRVSNYLNSLGMEYGNIDFEIDNGDFDPNDIDWNRVTHFSNKYSADIPDGLIPVLKKIFDYISENDLYESPDIESLNYENIEILIDANNKEITVQHYFSYYDEGDSSGTEWSLEEDPEDEDIKEIFTLLEEMGADGQLELRYNGGGDSGFLESTFENGEDVPANIEEWAYDKLERLHGGWEINEGSQGYFTFDIDNKRIELQHTYNTEESERKTIFEQEFGE